MEKIKVVVVLGPTASGKSDLAVEIAKRFNGEIISADSRQVYRGLNIGTGKVTQEEMQGIPHYLLDVADPSKQFTVSEFREMGQKAIDYIATRGRLPVICGGTGFYIDALIKDFAMPSVLPNEELRAELDKFTTAELFEKLNTLDLERAKTIDAKNRRRLIRALEIVITSGKPVPKINHKEIYDVLKIGIDWPREILKERIAKRLDRRLEESMIDEVKELIKNGLSFQRLENLGLEYRYIGRHLKGAISYEKMRDELYQEIVNYSKRQMTWFKRDKNILWISDPEIAYEAVGKFLSKDTEKK